MKLTKNPKQEFLFKISFWKYSLQNGGNVLAVQSMSTSGKRTSHWLTFPDSKVQGVNMGPTWVLSAPDGPHVGPMNLAIRVVTVIGGGCIPYLASFCHTCACYSCHLSCHIFIDKLCAKNYVLHTYDIRYLSHIEVPIKQIDAEQMLENFFQCHYVNCFRNTNVGASTTITIFPRGQVC